MYEKNEGPMGMHHDMGKKGDWITKKMIWEKLDDDAKKEYLLRKLDEKISSSGLRSECLPPLFTTATTHC
jgi:AbrB family looped-hinge helix DNA binding protein